MIKQVTVQAAMGPFKVSVLFESMHVYVYEFTVVDAGGNILQKTSGSSTDQTSDEFAFVEDAKYNNAYFLFSPIKILSPTGPVGNYQVTLKLTQDVVTQGEMTMTGQSNDQIAYTDCGFKINIA